MMEKVNIHTFIMMSDAILAAAWLVPAHWPDFALVYLLFKLENNEICNNNVGLFDFCCLINGNA